MTYRCLKTHHNGQPGRGFQITRKGAEREFDKAPDPKFWGPVREAEQPED